MQAYNQLRAEVSARLNADDFLGAIESGERLRAATEALVRDFPRLRSVGAAALRKEMRTSAASACYEARRYWGRALLAREQWLDAASQFRAAVELEADFEPAARTAHANLENLQQCLCCLGERRQYLDSCEAMARLEAKRTGPDEGFCFFSGDERSKTLVNCAVAAIELRSFDAALRFASESVRIAESAGAHCYASCKLGCAHLVAGEFEEAVRVLEAAEVGWALMDGMSDEDAAQWARSLRNNLASARNGLKRQRGEAFEEAEHTVEASADDDHARPAALQTAAVNAAIRGDFERAADLAEKACSISERTVNDRSTWNLTDPSLLPQLLASAFTIANCCLKDDDRAALHLCKLRQVLEHSPRPSALAYDCPICLEQLDWPAQPLRAGDRVTIRGLTVATELNGQQAVVLVPTSATRRRVKVRASFASGPLLDRVVAVKRANLTHADSDIIISASPPQRTFVNAPCLHTFHARCLHQASLALGPGAALKCPICRDPLEFAHFDPMD